jgi:hypothetical protein
MGGVGKDATIAPVRLKDGQEMQLHGDPRFAQYREHMGQ